MASCPSIGSLPNCSIPFSYIRPDESIAITPWVINAVLFAAHLISSITRVFLKPYDRSQLLAILLATYAVSITILGYQSTRFNPEKIFIWTPLLLGSDVAALIHLIKEQYSDDEPGGSYTRVEGAQQEWRRDNNSEKFGKERRKPDAVDTLCMIISVLLMITLVALQVSGLFFSISGFLQRNQLQLQTSWCSPAFQLGNTTVDSECTSLPITQFEGLGVACVKVPGNQPTWLGWTSFGLVTFLILEMAEFIVLFLPRLRNFRRRSHYRAPFVSTLAGIIVWFAFIMVAWGQMKYLPRGLNENRLGIVSAMEGTCGFEVNPGGLRGTIIAWSDGMFQGWSLYE